jgi:hypothetical protein
MEIEIKMTTPSNDVSDILQKMSKLIDSAKEQGFTIKELEIESDDEEEDE